MRQGWSRLSLKHTAVTNCCTAVLKSLGLPVILPRHSWEKVCVRVTTYNLKVPSNNFLLME